MNSSDLYSRDEGFGPSFTNYRNNRKSFVSMMQRGQTLRSNIFRNATTVAKHRRTLSSQVTDVAGFKGVKTFLTHDFQCRADLTITTFKEFFEMFIASMRYNHNGD
jgi:hypothetical protein